MATESGFNEEAVCNKHKLKKKHAHGLLQVTEETAGILKDHKGELSNYLINIKVSELYDPSINICCGIRWLFQKKRLATARLGRDATWEETIIDYKGYGEDIKNGKTPDALEKMRNYYNQLQGQ